MTDRLPSLNSFEHHLDPLVEARLANIVQRLRASWIAHMAFHWGDIHTIHEDACGEFEQRITTLLRQGFFKFGQLLCGFELLVLQSKQLGLVSEESVLGLEQLVVQFSDLGRDFVEIPDANSSLG